ncbi:hypothetical protein C4573_06870 [Candidatus Woesearchaeota archaeon]|nr:MAG: hypothetical protein C4573_06870 [Candidatus Woesearchaeota archaeon]
MKQRTNRIFAADSCSERGISIAEVVTVTRILPVTLADVVFFLPKPNQKSVADIREKAVEPLYQKVASWQPQGYVVLQMSPHDLQSYEFSPDQQFKGGSVLQRNPTDETPFSEREKEKVADYLNANYAVAISPPRELQIQFSRAYWTFQYNVNAMHFPEHYLQLIGENKFIVAL